MVSLVWPSILHDHTDILKLIPFLKPLLDGFCELIEGRTFVAGSLERIPRLPLEIPWARVDRQVHATNRACLKIGRVPLLASCGCDAPQEAVSLFANARNLPNVGRDHFNLFEKTLINV